MAERKITFGRTNLAPDAFMSINSSAGFNGDVDYLKNTIKSQVVEVTGTNAVITANFIAASTQNQLVGYGALIGLNIQPRARIRARNAGTGTWTAWIYAHEIIGTEAPTEANPDNIDIGAVQFYFDQIIATHCIFEIDHEAAIFGGANQTFTLQTVATGHALTLDHSLSYGADVQLFTQPTEVRTNIGRYYRRTPRQTRTLRLRLDQMSDSDRYQFAQMRRQYEGRPFMVDCFPDRSAGLRNEYNFYARIGAEPGVTMVYDDIHATSLLLLEA